MIELEFTAGSPLMFVFGGTIHTAKESYLIQFPAINPQTFPTFVNETTAVKRILLKVVEVDELKPCDALQTTNVFILFQKRENPEESSDLLALRNFQLPKSCRKFCIQFRDSLDFEVFDENFKELTLDEKGPESESDSNIWYQSKTFVKGFKDVLVNNKSIWN